MGKQGHAPCKISSPNNHKNHGRQLLWVSCQARRLGWAAPAYHGKEGATLHAGACRLSLQYDMRPDDRFGLQIGMWNLGSLNGKGGEV